MKINTQVHNKKSLKLIRKQLRNSPTSGESELWKHLKNRKLDGKKFRRQHSIGNFIVDFNCPQERIIVELDGEVHNEDEQREKDKERDEVLRDMGYRILRFPNNEVLSDVQKVLYEIKRNFTPLSIAPSFFKEGVGGWLRKMVK